MTNSAPPGLAPPRLESVALDSLVIDPAIQIRRANHQEAVERYVEMLEYSEAPPVAVVQTPDGALLLADGFHRTASYQNAGRSEIMAWVHAGDRELALELAVLENVDSKEALTSVERGDAIRRLHQLHPSYSRQRLAERMKVGKMTVHRLLNADEVRQRVTWAPITRITDVILAEIHGAPPERWAALAKAYDGRTWSRAQVQEAVRNLADDSVPEDYKAKLLAGDVDPGATVTVQDVPPFELEVPRGTPAGPAIVVAGADEEEFYEEPAGYDPVGSDVGERLSPIRMDCTIGIRLPSGKTRMRGGRQYERESKVHQRSYRLLFTDQDMDLDTFLRNLQRQLTKVLRSEGWPRRERVYEEA